MFRRKKKEEAVEAAPNVAAPSESPAETETAAEPASSAAVSGASQTTEPSAVAAAEPSADIVETAGPATRVGARGNRVQKVGIVASDKMQKTVVVRVDRLVKHMKYRRYVRRTSTFKAHDEMGAGVGDRVRIVETRPLSAQKRWRVVEILQKAAK
jgi:small subunit ribosomal protein S17